MTRKRARVTEEGTARMYEDVLDRLESKNEETSKHSNGGTSRQQKATIASKPRLKRTFYLPHEVVVAVEKLQGREFEETGKKPELSEIVERAILLLAKHSNI